MFSERLIVMTGHADGFCLEDARAVPTVSSRKQSPVACDLLGFFERLVCGCSAADLIEAQDDWEKACDRGERQSARRPKDLSLDSVAQLLRGEATLHNHW